MRQLDSTNTPLNSGGIYTTPIGIKAIRPLNDIDPYLKGHALSDQIFRIDILQSSDEINYDVINSFNSINNGTYEVCVFDQEIFGISIKFQITNTSAANMTVLRGFLNCI